MQDISSDAMDANAGPTSTYTNGYGTEDPADFIEKLGARVVSGVRRISKRQAEQPVEGYRMSIAQTLRKDDTSSKSAIVA